MNDQIELGVVRGSSYGVFGPPETFMPQARALGVRLARVFLTWHQIEPTPGSYDWRAVDALVGQLEPADRLWVTVVTTSRWATRRSADFMPASTPRDLASFQLFVGALVARFGGRVAYWQCNNEPSNPGLWQGSAADYAALANAFARTVRQLDPKASIVLGGCGFDVLSATPGSEASAFFDEILDKAGDSFDLFDIHLYDAPQHIPAHVGEARLHMLARGIEKPVVVGEYGGPTLLGFPELEPIMEHATAEGAPPLAGADLVPQPDTTDRRMAALYDQMSELPPQLQMFMQGCSPNFEAKRHRIACREVVTRNLYAMASGVKLTLAWNLAPEGPNSRDRFNLMGFLRDKLALMDFQHEEIARREPAGDAFARFAGLMQGASEVRRVETDLGIVAMEVTRESGPLLVFWTEADPFTGEDEPPKLIEWSWNARHAHVTDAFGIARDVTPTEGRLSLGVSVTPLFVWAQEGENSRVLQLSNN